MSDSRSAVARKARGAFFTPERIANFMVEWAVRAPSDRVLEPSCGEAAFLLPCAARLKALGGEPTAAHLMGVDIDADSIVEVRERLQQADAQARLVTGDFFEQAPSPVFDAVVGNPPYVRYQAFAGVARARAQEAALAQGVRLAGLSSSWAAFTVHAASFLTPAGRLALVLPAELLSVNYAAPVRRFLMQRFGRVRLILFEERVFPGVLEEVVLLLAEGKGPTNACELLQARNASDLESMTTRHYQPRRSDEKWTEGLLPTAGLEPYRTLTSGPHFEILEAWGDTSLGMVTGNNRYFTLTKEAAAEHGLTQRDLIKICPPGSRHLRGLTFTDNAWAELLADGSPGYLFAPQGPPSPAALAYIAQGEADRVPDAYKCRVRSPWWAVPRVGLPDAFLTYMNHDAPRIVTNRAGVAYLNSIHGISYAKPRRQLAMDLLPIAMLNSITLLGSELVGRAYGGGMLKLEPKEADLLPVPSFALVTAAADALRALRPLVSRELRQGQLLQVVERVDRVLRPHLQVSAATLRDVRDARAALFSRRVTRAKASL